MSATNILIRPPLVRRLGCVDYQTSYAAMRRFTAGRRPDTTDELWLLEHPPVYTLGQAGKAEHLLQDSDVPVLQVDRGGQITYHGPGQAIVYVLLDLRRRAVGVRALVQQLEEAVINLLTELGVSAARQPGAPGVYVAGAKIAALGLRVRNGCCYHGIALNVATDLTAFARINPCGYPGLRVTQLADLGVDLDTATAGERLLAAIASQLGCGDIATLRAAQENEFP